MSEPTIKHRITKIVLLNKIEFRDPEVLSGYAANGSFLIKADWKLIAINGAAVAWVEIEEVSDEPSNL